MSRPSHRLAVRFAPLLLLSGCATEGDFPSLLPREAERNVSAEEPVRQPPVVAPDPALTARSSELLAAARAGERDFQAAYRSADAATSRAGTAGSESWIEAQQALSRLEAARAATTNAVAELDRLAVERSAAATNAEALAAVRAAAEEAAGLARDQSERLERLRSRLRPG